MSKKASEFALTVKIEADRWALTQKRLSFLDAVIMQILKNRSCPLKEWFCAKELAELALTGLPCTYQGISNHAKKQSWLMRINKQGKREFHILSLPVAAFDDMLARIVLLEFPIIDMPPVPIVEPVIAHTESGVAPAWLLPLYRFLKQYKGDRKKAWDALAKHLPTQIPFPTQQEAAPYIQKLSANM